MRNFTVAAAVFMSIAGAVWIGSGHRETETYEPMSKMNADEMAVPEIGATVQDSLPKPLEVPDQAETHAVKKTTPKNSPTHNSEENLDADALDNMFKDAAELIL